MTSPVHAPYVEATTVRRLVQNTPHAGLLYINAAGLRWNGTLLPAAAIRDAVYFPHTAHGPMVRVTHAHNPWGHVNLLVTDEAQARAILHALGRDVGDATAHFGVRGPLVGIPAALALLTASIVGGVLAVARLTLPVGRPVHTMDVLAACGLLLLPHLFHAPWFMPTHLVVGTDGLLLEKPGRRRYIPYGAVARVDAVDNGVEVALHDGSTVRLYLAHAGTLVQQRLGAPPSEREAVLARLRAAMAPGPVPGVPVAGLLARGEQSPAAWLTSLRTLHWRQDGGMRTAPVRRTDLWRTVTDGAALPAARAAAAVALGYQGDDVTREGLRAAARASASPRLRVVLDAAARGADDGAMARALTAVEEESDRGDASGCDRGHAPHGRIGR